MKDPEPGCVACGQPMPPVPPCITFATLETVNREAAQEIQLALNGDIPVGAVIQVCLECFEDAWPRAKLLELIRMCRSALGVSVGGAGFSAHFYRPDIPSQWLEELELHLHASTLFRPPTPD